MEHSLSFIPLIIASFLMFVGMFGHLNFKFFAIQKIQIICAVIGALYGFLFFTNMYHLNVNFGVYVSTIHYLGVIAFITFAVLIGFYTRLILPNIIQVIGLILFFSASYFLLA